MVKRKSTPAKMASKRSKQHSGHSDSQGSETESFHRDSRRKQDTPTTSKTPSKRSKQHLGHSGSQGSESESLHRASRRKQHIPKKKNLRVEMRIGIQVFKIWRTTIKEIKRLQSDTSLLIPKLPFSRVVREILMEVSPTSHMIQVEALRALQESAELYLTYLFEDANKCAMHARRVTLMPKDIHLVLELQKKSL